MMTAKELFKEERLRIIFSPNDQQYPAPLLTYQQRGTAY
jgi:hypothetical protein